MAIFRKIHVSFWKDPFVRKLKPDMKLFYLYLMTNSNTKQCGIYEIDFDTISHETGMQSEEVKIHIDYLERAGKIIYNIQTEEVAIKNWNKYNDATSPKVKACINNELKNVKDADLLLFMNYDVPVGLKHNPNYRISDKLRTEIFNRDNNKCSKCDSVDNLTTDHIIPRSIGGKSIKENLRCLCQSCNSKRPLLGDELIDEVILSGYNFHALCILQGITPYGYSIGRQSQEEKEQDKEEEENNKYNTIVKIEEKNQKKINGKSNQQINGNNPQGTEVRYKGIIPELQKNQ
jgi:hypothetical protein